MKKTVLSDRPSSLWIECSKKAMENIRLPQISHDEFLEEVIGNAGNESMRVQCHPDPKGTKIEFESNSERLFKAFYNELRRVAKNHRPTSQQQVPQTQAPIVPTPPPPVPPTTNPKADKAAEKARIKALKSQEKHCFIGDLSLRTDKDGYYYFAMMFKENAPKYQLIDFLWDGPEYENVTTTKTKGKQKKKGGLGSALVGGVLFGPAGAVTGAVVGRKKVTTNGESVSTTKRGREISTQATLVFREVGTNTIVRKNTMCNSLIATAVSQLNFTKDEVPQQQTNILSYEAKTGAEELRQYKQLLDEGIITPQEFEAKKKQLLGI